MILISLSDLRKNVGGYFGFSALSDFFKLFLSNPSAV